MYRLFFVCMQSEFNVRSISTNVHVRIAFFG